MCQPSHGFGLLSRSDPASGMLHDGSRHVIAPGSLGNQHFGRIQGNPYLVPVESPAQQRVCDRDSALRQKPYGALFPASLAKLLSDGFGKRALEPSMVLVMEFPCAMS